MLIGQTKTFYWRGEKYIFERVDKGIWKCIYQDHSIISEDIIEQLGD